MTRQRHRDVNHLLRFIYAFVSPNKQFNPTFEQGVVAVTKPLRPQIPLSKALSILDTDDKPLVQYLLVSEFPGYSWLNRINVKILTHGCNFEAITNHPQHHHHRYHHRRSPLHRYHRRSYHHRYHRQSPLHHDDYCYYHPRQSKNR